MASSDMDITAQKAIIKDLINETKIHVNNAISAVDLAQKNLDTGRNSYEEYKPVLDGIQTIMLPQLRQIITELSNFEIALYEEIEKWR